MNTGSFLERWNRLGLQRQLITCLMAHMAESKLTELRIHLDSLDEITTGESLVMHIDGDNLVLRYVPEQVQLLTIQESGKWPSNTAASTSMPPMEQIRQGGAKSDSELAELESRQTRASALRDKASAARSQTLRNMSRGLTPDQPPLTGD